jgi:hypothetical protein
MPLEQAVTEAVRYCIRNRILARFLEEHGGEVLNMVFGEWDWDETKEAWQEEAREEAEAKYQPILAELAEKDRENQALRRKLQEAGIDS